MAERGFTCIGLDHHRTSLALRERLNVRDLAVPGLLADVCAVPGVNEAVVLSTCNRIEIYHAGEGDSSAVINVLAEEQGVDPAALMAEAYCHSEQDAVRHLFRVIASLESLVIGEYQIVHQVKAAYELARRQGRTGNALDPLFQRALAVAKEVRNKTLIGAHKVSVASVGVDLAKHIHGNLDRARFLLVGAGEISELAAVHLMSAGVTRITVVNRSQDRATNLATDPRFAAVTIVVRRWGELATALAEHDIVVTSTAAERPVITTEDVRKAVRSRLDPLMFIDLAVPRDVETAVGELAGVFRYDLDHLDHIVASNRAVRNEEVDEASALVDNEVRAFLRQRQFSERGLAAEISHWFERLAEEEGGWIGRKLPTADSAVIQQGARRLTGKMQHRIMAWLRQHGDDPAAETMIRQLLDIGSDLDPDSGPDPEHPPAD